LISRTEPPDKQAARFPHSIALLAVSEIIADIAAGTAISKSGAHYEQHSTTHRRPGQEQRHPAVHEGQRQLPQCGFSGRAIQILKACGVDAKSIATVNVLEDQEIRQGIKDYSQWPTIPSSTSRANSSAADIMMEMYESGELQQVLAAK
jgi:monothiol glutaredoxin